MFNELNNVGQNDLKKIKKEYYRAVRENSFNNFEYMEAFKNEYPEAYRLFTRVHHKRSVINNCFDAMKKLGRDVWFGTLTFNKTKDKNKIISKRKEAFTKLGKLFEYLLLVEEFGEEEGRYHIHFIGTYKEGKTFEDFKRFWHSRQNIRKVQENEKISRYLVKYMLKDLPRVRRNKALIGLEREYKKGVMLDRAGFHSIGAIQHIMIFDLLNADNV